MTSPEARKLPSVAAVLEALGTRNGSHATAVEAVRAVLGETRSAIRGGERAPAATEIIELARARMLENARGSFRRVINATGVILQTNLGRAPLSERAVAAMAEAAGGYGNLEFDLETGERGNRHAHLRDLIRRTTMAEDGIVVNNNAAALFMALQVFCAGREVIVSRGEAVEIGGGFRIPDVLRQSGARLVEVGTTNRTYLRDYEAAITEETAAILRVHPSNFRVVGFTASPELSDLAQLARSRGMLLLDDLGSGCLVPTEQYGLAHEPTVQEALSDGVDLALFSGDKLLGGPQCGIIAGRNELVEELRKHPLARALRVDKLTIAALQATLLAYAEGRHEDVPVWAMLALPLPAVRRRAAAWARAAGAAGSLRRSMSMVGGGSLPGEGVGTWVAAVTAESPDDFSAALRRADPPIVARIEEGRVLLDPRTVVRQDDRHVASSIAKAVGPGSSGR